MTKTPTSKRGESKRKNTNKLEKLEKIQKKNINKQTTNQKHNTATEDVILALKQQHIKEKKRKINVPKYHIIV